MRNFKNTNQRLLPVVIPSFKPVSRFAPTPYEEKLIRVIKILNASLAEQERQVTHWRDSYIEVRIELDRTL